MNDNKSHSISQIEAERFSLLKLISNGQNKLLFSNKGIRSVFTIILLSLSLVVIKESVDLLSIPNVEFVTLAIVILTLKTTNVVRNSLIVELFVFEESIIYFYRSIFYIDGIIFYSLVGLLLVLLISSLKNGFNSDKDNIRVMLPILALLFSLFFGLFYACIASIIFSTPFFIQGIQGIYFDLIHAVSNYLIFFLVFNVFLYR